MEEDLNVRKKAELTLGGNILLPKDFVLPYRVSRSTAGPGAGSASAVFSFGKHRVKKTVSYESGEFELIENEGELSLNRNGERFLEKIEIRPVVFHCPEQAFFNLDQRCIFNCAFCASPRLDKNIAKGLTDERIIELVKNALTDQPIVSISLTSGVVRSIDETVGRFVSCVSKLKMEFPDIPIGVEPYVSSKEHLLALKEAGVDEIKLNIETPDRDIFKKVCPELDMDLVLDMLEEAVGIFGKGKVTTNMIFGMGETDENIEEMAEFLCSKGIIPTLRALRTNTINSDVLLSTIGDQPPVDPERAISLTRMLKTKLIEHGLDTRDCHTMCLECTCCDLVPFRDL